MGKHNNSKVSYLVRTKQHKMPKITSMNTGVKIGQNFAKCTMAFAEAQKQQSKTPLVDEIIDTTIPNSPRYIVEITNLAKKLEIELSEQRKISINLKTVTEKAIHDKRKVLTEASVITVKNKKVPKSFTPFDSLSNDDVMERLRMFGFGIKEIA